MKFDLTPAEEAECARAKSARERTQEKRRARYGLVRIRKSMSTSRMENDPKFRKVLAKRELEFKMRAIRQAT